MSRASVKKTISLHKKYLSFVKKNLILKKKEIQEMHHYQWMRQALGLGGLKVYQRQGRVNIWSSKTVVVNSFAMDMSKSNGFHLRSSLSFG